MDLLEQCVVNKEFIDRADVYNISRGGKNPCMYGKNNPFFGKTHSNEVKKQNPEFNKAILSGSIFVNDDIYLNTVKKYLNKDIETVKVKLHQVYGAALLAAEMCSLDTEKIYNSFINNQAEG